MSYYRGPRVSVTFNTESCRLARTPPRDDESPGRVGGGGVEEPTGERKTCRDKGVHRTRNPRDSRPPGP